MIDKNADKNPEHYVENRDKKEDKKSTLENYSTLLGRAWIINPKEYMEKNK